MSSVCSAVQTIKSGDGSKTQFSFDFPYVFKSEVHVYFWNTTTKEYDEKLTTDSTYPWRITDANPTIVEFTGTAPPAPPSSDDTANVKIRRITNIDDIQALFNPGSAIRSDDLNSNFEQLRFAIQESLCPDISEAEVVEYLQDFYWNNFEDTVTSTDTWDSSDTKIATTAALDARFQDEAAETITSSETWPNDDNTIATTGAIGARHDVVVNTNVTPPSSTITGKQWLSTAPGNQVFKIYDGSGWRTVAVGQPYSPATTTVVRYVDVTNGSDASDVTGFLPQAPLQSIARALELINDSDSGDGTLIKVAAGVYQETLPLRIEKNNVSIVGESMRSCFVHPTVATENNDMFEVDSGSYIANLTLLGLKVPTDDQGSRNNSLDNDSTYGLPSNQPFAVRFRTDSAPTILKSPYIQNCTHFSDAHFDNANFDPNTFPSTDSETYSAVAGDESSAPCGGGLLVDGSAVSSSSPIRSMVVDAFTQITLDGPGILVTNNGYAQLVSFFGTFAHYHAKAKNGGQINLSNCVSDFGRYGLIADGKSPSAIATATASAANSGATSITIGAISTDSGFHGTVSRPLNHMMVTIDGVDYGVVSSTANGSGWDIELTSGLTSNITNTTVSFALRSYISTGGHTFEFVGVGTDYGDHPDKGGVPVEANQVIELNGGKVWQSSTDHVGKFKAGDVLVVDQVAETVDLKDTTVTGNITVTGTVDGRDVAADGTKLDGIESGATADQTAAEIRTLVDSATDSNVFTDADHTKLDGIATGATAYSDSDVDTHLNQSTASSGQVLSWDGSDYDWVAQSSGGSTDLVDDTTPQLGGNLDVNGNDIVSVSNGDIDLDPNGSGVVVFRGNSTKGSGQFKLNCEQNSHGITIKGPAHSAAADYTLTLPTTDGSANEILQTDGSGNLSWAAGGASEINGLSDGHANTTTGSVGLGTSALGNEDSTGTLRNTATGEYALTSLTSGYYNVANGWRSLNSLTTGYNNVGIGYETARSITTGIGNTALGQGAGYAITTGSSNTCLGRETGDNITTGNNNVAVGAFALDANTTASANVAVGQLALTENTTGTQNTALGTEALENNTTANSNVAVGYQALEQNTTGNNNVAVGAFALDDNTTASGNTAVGYTALTANTTGANNVAVGFEALEKNTTGTRNTAVGYQALEETTDGQDNTSVGYESLTANTTGDENVAFGNQALKSSTTAGNNSAFGADALRSATTGGNNVALGKRAGRSTTTGTSSTYVGTQAGEDATTSTNNAYVGYQAGYHSTGSANVAYGWSALLGSSGNTTGSNNVCIGKSSGSGLTSGHTNTFLGANAGDSATTGENNLVLGYNADPSSATVSNEITLGNASVTSLRIPGLQSGATDGQVLTYNSTNGNITLADASGGSSLTGRTDSATPFVTSLGHEAADSVGSTTYNVVAIGYQAAKDTTGRDNIAIGRGSLYTNSSGEYNVAVGTNALYSNTTASKNTSVGLNALYGNTTGYENTALGYRALYSNTTALYNTAVGSDTLYSCTTGARNTATGAGALGLNTTGEQNTASGHYAMLSNTTGSQNTATGYLALQLNTTGQYNAAFGRSALQNNTASYNTAVGHSALLNNTSGDENVALGYQAGQNITTGQNNTAVGTASLKATTTSSWNTALGYKAGTANTTGQRNVFLGYAGIANTTGSEVTAVGYGAGISTTVEAGSTYVGSYAGQNAIGDNNVSVGTYTLYGTSGSSGIKNTALGYMAGYAMVGGDNNTLVGANAGDSITSGDNNTCIGNHADASSATVDNEITLGNVNVGTLRCNTQTISSLSDGRDKTEVEDLPLGLEFINTLRPVKFKWDTRDGNGKDGSYDAGFIAQDLQSAQSASNAEYLKMVMDSNPDRLEARYGQLIPVLVQAIKDLKAEIDTLKANA